MRTFYSGLVALSLFSLVGTNALGQTIPTKKSIQESCATINFRFGKTVVDSGYMDNHAELAKMKEVFSRISNDPKATIDSISVTAIGSPDGPYEYNKKLTTARTQALKGYIAWQFPEAKQAQFTFNTIPEDWSGLRELIAADSNVPAQQKALDIIDSDLSSTAKENKLVALDGGKTHQYLRSNKIYAKLRVGASCTIWYTIVTDEAAIAAAEAARLAEEKRLADEAAAAEAAKRASEVVVEEVAVVQEPLTTIKERKPVTMGIKTNVPLLAATVLNLGVEFGFGGRYSVDIPVIFSPYAVSDTYKFKVATIQPEFRFWLKDNTKGSFFGVHAHTGVGSIISPIFLQEDYCYRTGRKPMYGFGVSYGYKLRLAKHWGLEGTIGAGYANIRYNMIPVNGNTAPSINNVTKDYWGITRAEINLIYNFNLRK